MIFTRLALAGLCLLVQSCATEQQASPELPAETTFNEDAGHGNSLLVTLHLEDGKRLPFLLDTGSPITVLDRSLEPELGRRITTQVLQYGWWGRQTNAIYAAPKLFLGNTELRLGKRIRTGDLNHSPGGHSDYQGILGMDCLQNYCLQLDFKARKLRFLDPQRLDEKSPGKSLSLTTASGQFFLSENLLGEKNKKTLIDTAEYDDGALSTISFQKGLLNQKASWRSWGKNREGMFPEGALGGETYTNLILRDCSVSADTNMNIIGLRFLARHLVTFDFPGHRMYLLRQQPETLGDWTDGNPYYLQTMEAMEFLEKLKAGGQMPGFQKSEHGTLSASGTVGENAGTYPPSRTFVLKKNGENDAYHYVVVKTTEDGSWKLQKAWRTDAGGQIVEEYPVP